MKEVYNLEDLGICCSLNCLKGAVTLRLTDGTILTGRVETKRAIEDELNSGAPFITLHEAESHTEQGATSKGTYVINTSQIVWVRPIDDGLV